ncbi:hypothetical protein [Geoalkalibacter halelectricus]|uniref:Glycosyltransferase RgtA/B/C/D-like domain-containing protein n=1 Tax=Geoalkalibacter halelectricus TaxID=2847045 RepID=A0ABY5ZK83_9BACT|nr:hypothetical protein [Geoalkalibacter halelectricus]MDO3377828.1 hypothetical protein [Geoalkalibacter halelectricus]UWZ79577.1 hypothetical protein L9S41_18130 [Geoalkalibacter halelectricus]
MLSGFFLIFFLAFASFIICALAIKRPYLKTPLIIALVLRGGILLAGLFAVNLPDSTADARTFQRFALMRSSLSPGEIISDISFNSYFYPDIIAILYSLFHPDTVIMHGVNLLAGVGVVYSVGVLAYELWGKRAAYKAAMVAALFPTLILYSAVTMREALLTLCLLLSCLMFIRWYRSRALSHAVLAMAFSFLAMCFHGAHAINLGWLLICMFVIAVRTVVGKAKYLSYMRSLGMMTVALALLLVIGVSAQRITIPKLGSLETTDAERLMSVSGSAMRDGASYPGWLSVETPADFGWKWSVRLPYFLFSPFPWDVRATRHLIGLADGLLYGVLFIMALRARGVLRNNKLAMLAIVFIMPAVMVYSMFIGNFGTGLRHRSKFVPIFIAIAVGGYTTWKASRRSSARHAAHAPKPLFTRSDKVLS